MMEVGSSPYINHHHQVTGSGGIDKRSPYMDEPYVFSVVQALNTPRSTSPGCRRMSDPGGRYRAVACIPHEYFVSSGGTGPLSGSSNPNPCSSSSSDNEAEESDPVFEGNLPGGKEGTSSHQSLFSQERARYRWSVPLLPAAAFTARRRSRASSLPRLDVPLMETSEEHEDGESTEDTLGKSMDMEAGQADYGHQRPQRLIRPQFRHPRGVLRQHSASRRRHSESLSLEVISEDSDWLPPASTSTSRRFSCSPTSG